MLNITPKKHQKFILTFLVPSLLFLAFGLFYNYNKETQAIAQVEELGAETCFKEAPIGGAIDESEALAKTILEQLKIMFEESAKQEEAVQALIPLFGQCSPEGEGCCGTEDDCCKPENCSYRKPDYPDGCKKTEEKYGASWVCGDCSSVGKVGCGGCSGPPPCLPGTTASCCCNVRHDCEVISRCTGDNCCPFEEMQAQLEIIQETNQKINKAYYIINGIITKSVGCFSDPDEAEKYGECDCGSGIGIQSCATSPNDCGCERKVKAYESFWPFLKNWGSWPNGIEATRRKMILKILDEVGSQIDFCVTPGAEEPEKSLIQCKVALHEQGRFLLSEIFWQCPETEDISPSIEACEFLCGGPGTCQQIEGVHPSHCSFFPLNYVCCEYAPTW